MYNIENRKVLQRLSEPSYGEGAQGKAIRRDIIHLLENIHEEWTVWTQMILRDA